LTITLILLGILVGTISAFFGIGGGMVLIPLLMLLGFEIKVAIGISIVQMVFSSLFGSYLNHKKGTLVWGEGIFIGLGGFVGGFIGANITIYIPDTLLEILFIVLLLFASFKVWFSIEPEKNSPSILLAKPILFSLGLAIGIFSMTLGIGGAIILTPILVGFLNYPLKKALSAGLFFVVFSSIAGLISRVSTGTIDFENAFLLGFFSLIGVAIGIIIKHKIHTTHHKRLLLLLYAMSLFIFIYKLLI
jgi:uncharacterized membrane protein YfcA